jgi:hypothetical protein
MAIAKKKDPKDQFLEDCRDELNRYLKIASTEGEFIQYGRSIQNGYANRNRDWELKELDLDQEFLSFWQANQPRVSL